jgi:hypothetical protein
VTKEVSKTTTTTKEEEVKPVEKKTAKAAVKKMIAPVRQNKEAMIPQFVKQFRPILLAELHRTWASCDPSPDQRRRLREEGERIIKEVAAKAVEDPQMRPGLRRVGGDPGQQVNPDRLISEKFVASAQTVLSPEQWEGLRAQADRSVEDMKSSGARVLVAWLDHELVLSAGQRDAISRSLADHWDEAWGVSAGNLVYERGMFPKIPDDLVVPHLDPTQRDVWKAMAKGQGNMFFSSGEGEGLKDDEPDEAAASKPANGAGK